MFRKKIRDRGRREGDRRTHQPHRQKSDERGFENGDEGYIVKQALEQEEAGADILDVNAGLPEIDEKAVLTSLVRLLQRVTDLPFR